MWPRLLGDESMITTAFALDATLIELVFVVGPADRRRAVAIAAAAGRADRSALVLVVVGAALRGRLARDPRAGEPEAHRRARLVRRAAQPRAADRGPRHRSRSGWPFGAFEIALPAFAEDHGAAGDAGVLIALWAVGSAIGGLVYGARDWRLDAGRRAGWLLTGVAAASLLLAPAGRGSMRDHGAAGHAGRRCIAPALASGQPADGRARPAGDDRPRPTPGARRRSSAGFAGGSAIGGALVEASRLARGDVLAAGAAPRAAR